ncbi:portal protein [Massilia aerilata]|uniref:Portal protein n=1 Tax=Massilia aerilata TaxID=453817 RepID=A0ABW0S338_9BURK
MSEQLQQHAGLANLLHTRLTGWEQARKPQELKMLECYQDVMRIPRADDTSGTGAARAKKAAGLFIGSTRNKVRAARAKINDALFGSGKLPFDTSPTNEQLAPFADAVEDILTEQFERMGLKRLLKTGVNTLATYGTGFMFGPFVRTETLIETRADNGLGVTQLVEDKYEFDFPYFELANTLDVIPDPEARDLGAGLGVFWATMESPHTVAAWKADKRYTNIDLALQAPGDNGTSGGSDQAGQLRANVDYWHKNSRIKVARFFGKVPKSAMPAAAPAEDGEPSVAGDSGEMVDAVVIMAGGVVVKVDESPYSGKNPGMRAVYEAVEHEMWGVGVAENNAPHQKVVNAAFRLVMEGKGMALLGTSSVDRSKFLPGEDFRKHPGKVYQMKPNLTPEERQTAIIHHLEPDITDGWRDMIAMSEQFSDDDTGITKYTQGDDSSHLNKTATGISMIMSASSLPIKEVIQNIDEQWIEEIVERTVEWNLKYLEVETVRKIHGDDIAQKWQQIKDFGKTSFMEWHATGTASFMQKEILTNKIRAFADFALSNPNTAPMVDARELLEQTWDVMEIGRESPILKDEDGLDIPPQVKQKMQALQEQIKQMGEALNNAHAEVKQLEAAAGNKDGELEVKAYEAETKRLQVVGSGMSPEQIVALVQQTLMQVLTQPAPFDHDQVDAAAPMAMPDAQPDMIVMPPEEAPMHPPEPAMPPEAEPMAMPDQPQ